MSYLNDLSRYNRYEDSNDIINKRTQDCRQHVKRVETVTENCPADSEGVITKTRTIYGSGKSFNCATTPDHYANWTIDNQCIKYPLCQAQFTTISKEACPEGSTGEIIKTKTLTSRYFGQYVSAAKCEDYLTKEDVRNLCLKNEKRERSKLMMFFAYNSDDIGNMISQKYKKEFLFFTYDQNFSTSDEAQEVQDILQYLAQHPLNNNELIGVGVKLISNPSHFSFINENTNEFIQFSANKMNNKWQVNYQSNMSDFSQDDFYIHNDLGWIFIKEKLRKYQMSHPEWSCANGDIFYQYNYGFINDIFPNGAYPNLYNELPELINNRIGGWKLAIGETHIDTIPLSYRSINETHIDMTPHSDRNNDIGIFYPKPPLYLNCLPSQL